jgi:hypothetical protein
MRPDPSETRKDQARERAAAWQVVYEAERIIEASTQPDLAQTADHG